MSENQAAQANEKPADNPPPAEIEITPEYVKAQNLRIDTIFAIAIAFFGVCLTAHLEDGPEIWSRLASGRQIAQTGVANTDTQLYTVENASWVNPNWLYDLGAYQIFNLGGDRALGIVHALFGFCIGALFLLCRRPGPTLWWSSLCGLLALSAAGLRFGINTETLAMLFLASAIFLWDYASRTGKRVVLFAYIPLTALWANCDITFFFAPAFLLLCGIGEVITSFTLKDENQPNEPTTNVKHGVTTLLVALAAFASALLSPAGVRTLLFPWQWFTQILPAIRPFDKQPNYWFATDLQKFIGAILGGELLPGHSAWALLVIGVVASFLLHINRFSISRALVALVAVVLPMLATRFMAPAGLVLGYVVAVNGHDFFLATWGDKARISTGWILWSQVGRLFTVVVLFFALVGGFTGRIQGYIGREGFGINRTRYMEQAADWLKQQQFVGNTFSMTEHTSSYLAWGCPERKRFADSRLQLQVVPVDDENRVVTLLSKARSALANPAENDPSVWLSIFDRYKISHVVVDAMDTRLQSTTFNLMNSPLFRPVFVSDQAVVLMRSDEKSVDRQLVEKLALDTNRWAFREKKDPPKETLQYVRAPGIIDAVWHKRDVLPVGAHSGAYYLAGTRHLKPPGSLYRAVYELRNAVAENPDNGAANLRLGMAYTTLFRIEAEQFALVQAALEKQLNEEKAKKGESANPGEPKPAGSAAQPKGETPKSDNAKPAETKVAATPEAKPAAATKAGEPKPVGELAKTADGKTAKAPAPAGAGQQTQQPLMLQRSRDLNVLRHCQIMAMFTNATTADPSSMMAHMQMFDICKSNDYLDLALAHFDEALKLMPPGQRRSAMDQFNYERMREIVTLQRDEYGRRVEEMQKELEKAGADPDRPLQRARMAFDLGLARESIAELDKISEFSPELVQNAAGIAEMYLQMGLPEKAFEKFQSAQRNSMEPGQEEWFMARIHIINGQYGEARSRLETAIAKLKQLRAARMLEGMDIRTRTGAFYQAPDDTNNVMMQTSRLALYHFMLGLTRIEMGEPQLAIDHFKEVVRLEPTFLLRPVVEYYWGFLTDEKLPPRPPLYTFEQEIAKRFAEPEAKKPDDKSGKTAPEAKPTDTKPAEKKDGAAEKKDAPATKKDAPSEKKTTPAEKKEATPEKKATSEPKVEAKK